MEEENSDNNNNNNTLTTALQSIEDGHPATAPSTPVTLMTNALSTFMADVFEEVRQENMYINKLREDILNDLPNMKASEKIALITNETTNRNDMTSKVISPTMQLMTTLQQNELQERKERAEREAKASERVIGPNNIVQVSDVAPAEVLAGLQALFNLQAITNAPRAVAPPAAPASTPASVIDAVSSIPETPGSSVIQPNTLG